VGRVREVRKVKRVRESEGRGGGERDGRFRVRGGEGSFLQGEGSFPQSVGGVTREVTDRHSDIVTQ